MSMKWRKSAIKRIKFQDETERRMSSTTRLSQNKLEKEFLTAVKLSDIPKVRECIQRGVNVNVYNFTMRDDIAGISTALHIAAEKDDLKVLEVLFTCPELRLNSVNGHGFTPLHIACQFAKDEIALALLKQGVNPNFRTRLDKSPLHICLNRRCYKIVFHLMRFGADVNLMDAFERTPLSLCLVEYPNIIIAKFLMRHGVDLTFTEPQRYMHVFFETVLHCGHIGWIDYVLALLEYGFVDINMTDRFGRTVFHFIAITGYLPLAMLLAHKHGNFRIADDTGRTPQMVAQEHGNVIVAEFFHKGLPPRHNILDLMPMLDTWKARSQSVSRHHLADENNDERGSAFYTSLLNDQNLLYQQR